MKSLSRAVAALVAAATTSPSGAAREFFGEDPGGCLRGEYPNATAARDKFFSLLVGVGTETFESFSRFTDTPFTVDLSQGLNATLESGSSGSEATIFDFPDNGRCAISQTKYLVGTARESGPPLLIKFSAPVAAFGFYGTDIGDGTGEQASIVTLNGVTKQFIIPHTNDTDGEPRSRAKTSPLMIKRETRITFFVCCTTGSVFYFGLVDMENPFKSLQLNMGYLEKFGFDDFSAGTPEQVKPSVRMGRIPSWQLIFILFFHIGASVLIILCIDEQERQECLLQVREIQVREIEQ